MERTLFVIGAGLGFLSVALGAFAAHILKGKLAPDMMAVFETGVRYQMGHALAILVVAWASAHWNSPALRAAGWFFTAGVLLFSGSLYALALSGIRWLGAVTPVGGVCFLIGWGCLVWAGWRS
ncbi:MAG: DUF423 domain-containing protein [Acidobacteriota bacterium]